jgi:hypothetical protein
MTPFEVAWSDAALDRLRTQVRAYRFPPAPEKAGWRYGCDPTFLGSLCAYWAEGFDMRGAEAALNRFPQVICRVEDIDIHAVHVVGEAGGRRPLLLIHGWPGSVLEFWEAAEPLAFPSRFGGRPENPKPGSDGTTRSTWSSRRCPVSGSPASRARRSALARPRACLTR